jgi:allantoin racemase
VAASPTLLLINPNSSDSVTDRLSAEAARIVPNGVTIRRVTATGGPVAIQTPQELDMARSSVRAIVGANTDCAAAVIGAFGDPGLAEARLSAGIPVAGLGESGILAAGEGGRRFSIVTVGEAMRPQLLQKIAGLRLSDTLVSLRFLPHSVVDVIRDRGSVLPVVAEAIGDCIVRDGAETVLLGGAPFVGAARELGQYAAAPVIDGLEAAIHFAFCRRR